MSDPIKHESAGAAVEETKTARMSLRRKQEQGIEIESKVERPQTVPVFQASPTSVAGVLAQHGVTLETTLQWGHGASATKSPGAGAPVFVVGAGREFLAEVLEGEAELNVGSHGGDLAHMTQAIQDNWSSLAREGYPEQYWYKKVGEEFAADRTAEADGRRWAEVLDTSDLSLDTLDRMFPRCLIVNVVGGWLQGGLRPTRRSPKFPAARYLEVRIADVKANPELVRHQVLGFLRAA